MRMGLMIAATALAVSMPAFARDHGQYAASDTATSAWFSTLQNGNGFPCCDQSDGHRIEDPNWRQNADNSYSVRLAGDWQKLDPALVLTQPNRVGYAVVWQYQGRVTCFIPGPRS